MQTLNIVSLRKRLLQDHALVAIVLEQYSHDLSPQLESLQQAFAAEDMREIARLAHKMKGSSGNVGAERLQEMASKMEQAALREDLHDVDTVLIATASHIPVLKEEIESILQRSSAS